MAASVPVVVCGAAGRMGRRIIALAEADPHVHIVGAVEAPGSDAVGRDAGEMAGAAKLGVAVVDDYARVCDASTVTLDFTAPAVSLANVETAAARGAAIVVGTSGLSREERGRIEGLSTNMATMVAANMSVGVNVLLSLVADAVRRLGDRFDCEIVEIHHNRKKDAPSGTAIALAEAAAAAAGWDPDEAIVAAREGFVGERGDKEIGVVALRGGDNVGEHSVYLVGAGERLELTHRAASRDCLAGGALVAAAWLAGKPAGFYSMQDVVAGA